MSVDCLSVGILVADHLCSPISHVPAAGELVLADQLLLNIGGCAANAATDLARVGVRVGVVGCVGNDIFGDFVINTLAGNEVDVSGIKRESDVGTSGTLILNVRDEDRRFVHAFGANARLTAADVPRDRLKQAKVLYIGGYLVMPSLVQDDLLQLFREAREAGVKTVLDVVLPSEGEHWSKLERLLGETDVFLPNLDEAAVLTGQHDPIRQAEVFRRAGAGTVVITCGDEGAVLVDERVRLRAGRYPTDYIGGTGAGDAFDAGYIAGMLAGADPRDCLKWGSALGASCVRSITATDTVFTRSEAEEFIRKHELPMEEI